MHGVNDNDSDPFPQLGSVYGKGSGGSHVKHFSKKNVTEISVVSSQNGKNSAKAWGPQSSTPGAWGCPNLTNKLGMQSNGNVRTTQNADSKNLSSCGNELSSQQNRCIYQGWNATAHQVGSTQLNSGEQRKEKDEYPPRYQAGVANNDKTDIDNDDNDDDEILFGNSDDGDMFDDDSDLDKRKWFKSFFDDLDKLNVEELNSSARKWHCPACKGGPGAIDWYRGLEPLMYHALTRKTRRVKLHRVFAELLNEETQKRGISIVLVDVAFGRWKGLNEKVKDYEIVWPPMVVIMNTRYEQEDNGKWIGMGNQELLDHFKSYAALKARHSYGPQGHRGMSVLIFDDTTAGYLEAARLHKHFKEQGRDREAWKSNRFPFCSDGKRQLYGYMALKEDLIFFNQHSQGRSRLKFEMRSYQEMVERQIKQINDNNQQLAKFKNKAAKEPKDFQILAEYASRLSEKLHETTEENHNTRQQTKFLLETNREEMNSREQFLMDQIKFILQAVDAKVDKLEDLQRANGEKTEQTNADISTIKYTHGLQDKDVNDFETEKRKLIKIHEDKKASIIKKCCEELLHLEKEFENELTQHMIKYNLNHPEVEKASNGQPSIFN